MAERIISRREDGRWVVTTSVDRRFVSSHERREDAIARAITGLRQVGGGFWILRDEAGKELDAGTVRPFDAR
jgi:hypothetical protein